MLGGGSDVVSGGRLLVVVGRVVLPAVVVPLLLLGSRAEFVLLPLEGSGTTGVHPPLPFVG